MKTIIKSVGKIFWIDVLFLTIVFANEPAKQFSNGKMLEKSASTSDIWMNCNRMNGVFRNNGVWFYDNVLGDWGLEWPKGSGLSPIFAAGEFLCATIEGEVRVAGTQHSMTEYQPGMILSPDHPDDPSDSKYRWYELQSDGTGDWTNWPSAAQGAPLDEDGNPLLIGDRTIFSVWNDLRDYTGYDTLSLNAEFYQTAWAYARTDAFGDMIFLKWTIVNKSGKNWEDASFAIWSDPDLGFTGDDLVGCDTTLGLCFCYNSTNDDQNYGEAPPAVGFKILQGPIVSSIGDTAFLPNGTVLPDKKMQKMTAFYSPVKTDGPEGSPDNAQQVNYILHGQWRDGSYITEGGDGTDQNNPRAKFMYSGDPATQSGWLDSQPNDRRFFMATGPITLEPWVDSDGDNIPEFGEPGVQDIIAVTIVARGSNNLNSVTKLKNISQYAQAAYEQNFILAHPPIAPKVSVSELANELILTWDERSEYNSDGSAYESTDIVAQSMFGKMMIIGENYKQVTDDTYNFTGYTIYQYSDSVGSDPVVYAKYDFDKLYWYEGKRYISIRYNLNPNVDKRYEPLINNRTYYFGIEARAYCEFASPQVFSRTTTISGIPQNHLGERYSCEVDSSILVTYKPINNSIQRNDGSVEVIVVDPSKTTGRYYCINFNSDLSWNLISAADSNFTIEIDTILSNQHDYTQSDAFKVTDGLLIKVMGPISGIKQIAELNPNTLAIYDANLWGSLNNYGISQYWPIFVLTENTGTSLTRLDLFGLMTPKDYDIIFTDTDSTLIWDYLTNLVLKDTLTGNPSFVPFTVWKIDTDGSRTRLPVCILDADSSGTWNRSQDGIYGPAFDMLYIYDNAEYKPTDVATYISSNNGTSIPGYGPNPAINHLMINM
ncbi:MAG: hypothetical protein PHW79_11235, partial [Candidatus Marinimicrobia bacterium]|nr:hypothetical protein [Candidatus Neomarinimicrobiota bacterium]